MEHDESEGELPIVRCRCAWYIAELFKVENHEIAEIEAVLERVPYGMNSGWSTWEAGMSDRAQDATM
jgi:hypothetical protein